MSTRERQMQKLENVARELASTALTVRDLRELLKDHDPSDRVVFVCSYGDYHKTQQMLPVASVDQMDGSAEWPQESAYSLSGLALEPLSGDEGDEDPDQAVTVDDVDEIVGGVVVLRM